MNVLVFCLYKRKFEQTERSIHRLEWDRPLDILFLYGKPDADRRAAIARGRQEGRRLFLAGKWDAVLTVDSDMIVPPDALRKLAEVQADVAYGLYCSRWRYNWQAYVGLDRDEPVQQLSKSPRLAMRAWGKVLPVTGKGWGCTLVQRHVMEQVEIRNQDGHFADHWLATQANRSGWKQKCHLGVVCGHILHASGVATGGVVWPTGQPPFYEIKPLEVS